MLVLTLVVHAALASAAPLDDAVALAAADAQLAAALAPRPDGWLSGSDGPRTPGDRALHGHAAAHANGPLRIGASSALSLTLSPRGARRARVELADGRLVYRDAWRSADLLVTAPERGIEWFVLLRDDTAPSDFSWDVGLGDALTALRPDGHGGLAVVDREGTTRLVMAAPYAVDARGTRRAATLSVTGRRLTLSLDRAGLTYPVLLDPLVDLAVWELKATGLSRNYAAMAYDTARSRAVLFGGADLAGNVLRTTLEWNGLGWTPVSSTGPSARLSPAMAYDSVRQRTVLFGGSGGGLRGDTWEWDGMTWVLVAAEGGTGPSVRAGAAMAYDAARQRVVLFGGNERSDTWEWDGVSWQLRSPATVPGARSNHVMAFDVARGRVVMTGGFAGVSFATGTWEWDGTNWTNAGGGLGLTNATMAYDTTRARIVVYGGWSGSASTPNTFEWDGMTWASLTTNNTPPARNRHAMAWDSARQRMVVQGGARPDGTPMDDTWELLHRLGCTLDTDCPVSTNACLAPRCTVATGLCTTTPRANGTTCNDGNACTQADSCQAGACTGANPVVCAAPDACHLAGVCDPTSGVCNFAAKTDGATCSDGNGCTLADACLGGVCVAGAPKTCVPLDTCHLAGTCDMSTGTCSNPAKPDAEVCDDANACTSGERCVAGVCGQPASTVTCTALDACHLAGTCNTTTGVCSNPARADGFACDDQSACTAGESCQGGVCTPATRVQCAAPGVCHAPGVCDPGTGVCSDPRAPDGTGCDDGKACTLVDHCSAGACVPQANQCECLRDEDCSALDQCHLVGRCDATTNQCTQPAKPDDTACDDGNACTSGERCIAGSCGSPPTTVSCPAPDACHQPGTCEPTSGACSTPVAVDDGTSCDGGTCQGGQCLAAADAGVDAGTAVDAGADAGTGVDAGLADAGTADAGDGGVVNGSGCGCTAAPVELGWLVLAALGLRRRREAAVRR